MEDVLVVFSELICLPPMGSPERGWVTLLPHRRRAALCSPNPYCALGVAICQLALPSRAFILLRALPVQKGDPSVLEAPGLRELGVPRAGLLSLASTCSGRALGQVCSSLGPPLSGSFSAAIFYFSTSHFILQGAFQHVGLTASFYGRKHDSSPHFTEEKTEAQRDAWMCPWSHHWYGLELELEPRYSDSTFTGSAILGAGAAGARGRDRARAPESDGFRAQLQL